MEKMISIIVPVYNASDYIIDCLNSVFLQTYSTFEVLAINDGSTDNSLEILNKIAIQDSRLRVIDQENKGVSSTRNTGLKYAKGEYILFLDSDDTIDASLLQDNLNLLIKYQVDLVIFGFNRVFLKNTKISTKTINSSQVIQSKQLNTVLEELVRKELIFPPFNKLFKKEIIDYHNLQFDCHMRYGEDFVFVTQYLDKCSNIYLNSKAYYNYLFDRPTSAMNRYDENKLNDQLYVHDYLEYFLKKYEVDTDSILNERLINICYDGILNILKDETQKKNIGISSDYKQILVLLKTKCTTKDSTLKMKLKFFLCQHLKILMLLN